MSGRAYLMINDYQLGDIGELYGPFIEFIRDSGGRILPEGFIYGDPPQMMTAIEAEPEILERILSQLLELLAQIGIRAPYHEIRETLPEGARAPNFNRDLLDRLFGSSS